jgi:hypothetical protein
MRWCLLIIVIGTLTDWMFLRFLFLLRLFISRRGVTIFVLIIVHFLPIHVINVQCVAQLGVQILITLLIVVTALFFLNLFHLFVQVFNLVHHLLCFCLKIFLENAHFLTDGLFHANVDAAHFFNLVFELVEHLVGYLVAQGLRVSLLGHVFTEFAI